MADRLNWKGLSTAFGIFSGIYLGAAALLASQGISALWFNPESFRVLAAFFPGLAPTMPGALYGLVMGAVCGAFCGGVIAGLYNWGSKKWH